MAYPSMNMEKLYEFLMSTFSVKEALKTEKNRTLWNIIFNYGGDKLDCCDRDGGVGCTSST